MYKNIRKNTYLKIYEKTTYLKIYEKIHTNLPNNERHPEDASEISLPNITVRTHNTSL